MKEKFFEEAGKLYQKFIDEKYVQDCKENSFAVYEKYSTKDEDNRQFEIPNYSF